MFTRKERDSKVEKQFAPLSRTKKKEGNRKAVQKFRSVQHKKLYGKS